ncbi:DUF3397 family protein [Levilactobacillus hammesii]|uniref:Integral membrane protein n=1 Tax=Levilactobacillus hammesii DSM 16381 TaxID=1423753 RepID=A0A0R1UND0_9LACO|nr:DUF3397 family protein [Levilactobacillus hammesii]KRL94769.1 hypothetical protein FD28_GL000346 [Levilactobacillus hammesii DSM 16381]
MKFWTSPGGQLAILVIGFLVIRGVKHLLRKRWPTWLSTWDLMAPLFLLCALILIPVGAGQIMPWLIIGWMAIGIIVTLMQAIRNHEILYSTFFKTFWRLTDLYWLLGFSVCFLLVIS